MFASGVLVACGSSSPSAMVVGGKLAAQIIPAPYGYQVDPSSSDVQGVITPAVFDGFGGVGSPKSSGFVAGFRESYVDYSTEEGLSITLLTFKNASDAMRYLKESLPKTLEYTSPTTKAFTPIPTGIELSGTKAYGGDYLHGMVMVHAKTYAQVVYATSVSAPVPIEFYTWTKVQYDLIGTNSGKAS
jgi:hypothetical protein